MGEGTAPAKERKKAPAKASIKGVNISPSVRVSLYSQARYLPQEFRDNSGLRLPFVTYFQDPWVAAEKPEMGFDEDTRVDWEPGLTDGPTSSRFAVVDFNGDTGKVNPAAVWDEKLQTFTAADGTPLTKNAKDHPSFHQVNVWVLLQRALAFFEDGSALGRRIPWAFEGNRLIVVPHAGFAQNAFYDRQSKSLQFYYFGDEKKPVFTCLSTDIVCHEFAHAVLDGVRPLFNESISAETAAFHEFMGDISAILLTLRNNSLRRQQADEKGDLKKADTFAQVAEEFGQALDGHPYLRTGRNTHTMQSLAGEREPHKLSEVLTGAMYDLLLRLGEHYSEEEEGKKKKTARQVFWAVADRMPRMAIQPLDLLPPVEVTFHDYALAVCRSQQLSDPMDPNGYYGMLLDVFVKRGIMNAAEAEEMKQPRYLNERMRLSVRHSIDDISRSRAAAYRFLDDNREDLLIPANRDFFVADLYDAKKRTRQNVAMPRQIVLQYVWREEVKLDGARFGKFNGRVTSMLCGGTLVFDEIGNVLHWAMKPGSQQFGGKRPSEGQKMKKMWGDAVAGGTARRAKLLDDIAAQLAAGRVGSIAATPKGMLGSVPPVLVDETENEEVRFTLPPHMGLSSTEEEETGERQWQISC